MSQDLDDLFITETDRAQRLHVGICLLYTSDAADE